MKDLVHSGYYSNHSHAFKDMQDLTIFAFKPIFAVTNR